MADEARQINARPIAPSQIDLAPIRRPRRVSGHVLLSVVRPSEASNSLTAGTSIASVVNP
jgi:hypothetical protein